LSDLRGFVGPGTRHGNADGLSRKPVDAEGDDYTWRAAAHDAQAAETVVNIGVLDDSAG